MSAVDVMICLLQASAASPRGTGLRYPLCKRLGGPHSWTGRFGYDIDLLLPPAGLSGLQPGH